VVVRSGEYRRACGIEGGAVSRFVPRLRLWKYYTMLFVVHTIGRLPLRYRYGVAVVVANRVYAWRRSIREALRSNIRHVLGPEATDAEVDLIARECARNAGRNYADIVGMHRMNVRKFYEHSLVLEGIEYVKEAQAQGRGVVMASAHYANPELATQGLVEAGVEVFALVEPLQPPQLNRLMYSLRNQHGHHYEPATFGGVKAAIDWLRKGGALAILIDRDIQKRGIELEFCGAKARFPTGAVDLAIRTNSVLIPGWVHRQGGFRTRATIGPPLDHIITGNHDEDLRVNTARLLAIFEHELKADPTQWTVLEKVWKD
jgi:KDO2-lipid IV(A) lauroyltransferase